MSLINEEDFKAIFENNVSSSAALEKVCKTQHQIIENNARMIERNQSIIESLQADVARARAAREKFEAQLASLGIK